MGLHAAENMLPAPVEQNTQLEDITQSESSDVEDKYVYFRMIFQLILNVVHFLSGILRKNLFIVVGDG